ncbi:MAG: hypothetical protein QW165_02340 [Candidatus Woesearchaeota archaeon]
MEPIKYFDAVDLVEPHCKGCQHIIHYDRDTTFDNKKQVLTCRYCGSAL